LKERLESHESDRKVFEKFRNALAELAVALSKASGESELDQRGPQLPLIFIIDEMDRCRPSFALELLEKIKHFFAVPNVIFVLVSSLKHLEGAVKHSYGNIDAQTYLEKFYHLRILFPAGRKDRHDLGVATYLRYLKCNETVAEIIDEFSGVHPLSFRTLERIAAYSHILHLGINKNGLRVAPIIAVLCVLKVICPDVYDAARKTTLTPESLQRVMAFDKWRNRMDPSERSALSQRVEDWWMFSLGEMVDDAANRAKAEGLMQHGIVAPQLISYFCDRLDEFAFVG
jgi:hypothetical protein